MKRLVFSSCLIFKFFITSSLAYAGPTTDIPQLPKGYRAWSHTKSMVIPDKSHALYGFHNIYANPKATRGLLKKGGFENGSAFVVSFYDVVDKDGTVNQGAKTMDAVMIKDAKAKATGGWYYGVFQPNGKPKPINAAKDCFECHKSVQDSDYVFHKFIR
ncbi:MAG: cytochrome P460 family protein [Oligoflexus sp.]